MTAPRDIGRYRLYDEIASGGMATVHIGRLQGPGGFARTVAIKRLHAQYARDPEFVSMFLDEARLAARIHHPNVAATLDVVALRGELFLVMEYVQGESLARLSSETSRTGRPMPLKIVATIVHQALQGLHAAHEAVDDGGTPLQIVHRDVSPQNVLVGADGVARVVDFGVAKAATRLQSTGEGQIKGKLGYMAPEQLRMERVDRRTDVFAAGVVLWEALSGDRLFVTDEPGAAIARILTHVPPPPSRVRKGLPASLDAVVARALSKRADDRFATALEMAKAIEAATPLATAIELSEWVKDTAGSVLDDRARKIKAIESASGPEAHRPDQLVVEPSTGADLAAGAPTIEQPTGRRRSRSVLLVAAAALLVASAVAYRWLGAGASSARTVEGAPPAAVVAAPVPTAAVSPPRPAIAPPGQPSPAAAPPTPEPRVRPVSRKRATSKAAPTAKAEPRELACSPPYVITAEGVKRFKPECLR